MSARTSAPYYTACLLYSSLLIDYNSSETSKCWFQSVHEDIHTLSVTGSSDTWNEIRYIALRSVKNLGWKCTFLLITVSFSPHCVIPVSYSQGILPFIYYVYRVFVSYIVIAAFKMQVLILHLFH